MSKQHWQLKLVVALVAVIAAVALSSSGAKRAGREAKLNQLMQGEQHREISAQSSQKQKEWMQRNRQFAQLWLSRRERDVSDEILLYVKDPDERLRWRAVRALGRLEKS